MTAMGLLRVAHIAAGTVALGAFWIPLVARKGSPLHRRAGWVYAVGMWAAAIAAWGVCALRLTDDNPANDAGALFLSFVGLLAANGAASGIRVLRTKGRTGRASALDVGSAVLFLVAALALGVLGVGRRSPLFLAFAALGVFLAIGQLRYWLKPRDKLAWWYEHMGNMLAACIGTVTAFLVVNVPRFGLERYALFFWLGPGVVGGLAIVLWQRHYRRKHAARAVAEVRAPAA